MNTHTHTHTRTLSFASSYAASAPIAAHSSETDSSFAIDHFNVLRTMS